jgi:hypothetical protein
MFILKRKEFSLRYIIIIKQYVKYNRIKPEIQFVKGAGSADHSLVCKHSLVSPYSVPLDEDFSDLCLQWPVRCSLSGPISCEGYCRRSTL